MFAQLIKWFSKEQKTMFVSVEILWKLWINMLLKYNSSIVSFIIHLFGSIGGVWLFCKSQQSKEQKISSVGSAQLMESLWSL